MDALAALSTIAAIAVTLTGFAGLLAAFRNSDRWQPVELFAVRYLLLTSASGCLLALLPIPMAVGRYDDFWRPCLLILTAWLLLTIGWTLTESVRRRTRPRRPIRYVVTQAAGLGLAAWAVLTALGSSEPDKSAVYLWGLLWFVATSISQLVIQITHGLVSSAAKRER
ncbi:MAG: hypothetical protein ACJ8FS_16130 [Sphingomicrobium sp.]